MRRMRVGRRWTSRPAPRCAPAGSADIFDPALRASIAALIDDVRARGDVAVCRRAGPLRRRRRRARPAARRPPTSSPRRPSPPAVDAALDDAIAHCRAFNEQLLARAERLELRDRARPAGRREGHADRVGRAVRAVRQGELPERRLPARRARRRSPACPQIVLVVPPVPGGGGAVDPAVLVVCRKLGITDVFRVNGPAGLAALGVRHGVDPPGPQGRRPGLAGGDVRPGRAAAPRRRRR